MASYSGQKNSGAPGDPSHTDANEVDQTPKQVRYGDMGDSIWRVVSERGSSAEMREGVF